MPSYKLDRPLTQSKLKEQLNYNPVTGIFTWRIKKSRKSPIGSVAGMIAKRYRRIKIGGVGYYASRLAWLYTYGDWPTGYLDHINGVRSDDRLCNLRTATAAESATNRVGWSCTGVKGVHLQGNGTYWAKIGVGGKVTYLGTYATLDEAAAVRKAAALRLQGSFAVEAQNG